jgi:hypothetical protein
VKNLINITGALAAVAYFLLIFMPILTLVLIACVLEAVFNPQSINEKDDAH